MRVEDACRPGLFTVDIDDSLEVAAHRMDQAQLGALAVVDGQRLVGIVTERGLVRAIAGAADPADVPVAAYASSAPRRPVSTRTPGQSSNACSSWGFATFR
jgi:CBS domain-containing protein